jgi:hypothetical protein
MEAPFCYCFGEAAGRFVLRERRFYRREAAIQNMSREAGG